ncbi:maleylpyruvate isomerase N-terminal domain-containing protein [Nocardiopsis alba]|uniref:Mycothiol maleylpyruvate isomerase N-terminal domain protein n=1 Tax=Nocardiopsis alba (strain ATCC BAA-2165 / BE74) TaxID=1205910 RepID=J7L404_NOCAA|nr:maleylpyruvate isomerase N-terminal domain-containing protein [Nocardiopsis alba]AFR08393.1 mycothiol maleylpyruvate isomerase N-terminal domain protein [Nocardiopsis alba ATCC BAA-2165]
MDLFAYSWAALRAAVADLPDEDFARPSGCTGWLVRDLVFHLVIDAQDVLITLVTPTEAPPTRDAATYWDVSASPPAGDGPFDALTVRLAAAYEEPRLLRYHLDEVLTVRDYLDAYVLEWTLHHLDLIAHLPDVPGPPPESSTYARRLLERIAGAPFPGSLTDEAALRVGTGRRAPTEAESSVLDTMATRLPLVLS